MDEIENVFSRAVDAKAENSPLLADAPPSGHWTNTYYFNGGFAVMVQFQ